MTPQKASVRNFAVTPAMADDFKRILSVPVTPGNINLRAMFAGEWFNANMGQAIIKLRAADGATLDESKSSVGGYRQSTTEDGPVGGSTLDVEISPAPTNGPEFACGYLDASITVLTPGNIELVAATTPNSADVVPSDVFMVHFASLFAQ